MRLLTPGPVPVPKVVLQSFSEPILHHRTPEFEQILSRVLSQMKKVFGTQQSVCLITGTGSSAMEAAIVNTLSPGDEVLVVVSGKFGERWADMCDTFGLVTHRMNVEWGEKLKIDDFIQHLKFHNEVKAVFTQVCETSTATLHPIQHMARLTKEHTNALFIADAITAMGCLELPMDDWDIDVIVAGSQKAFMLPTGLSFIALSERAWRESQNCQSAKYYLDLQKEKKSNEKNQTYYSTPTPLIKGLDIVLQKMTGTGLKKIQSRCDLLAEVTRTTALKLNFKTFSKSPSPSVTALLLPDGVPGESFRDWLESEKKICVMGGQDQLKGKIIRIGHMGDITNEDMIAFFQAIAEGADHWLKTTKHAEAWTTLRSEVETTLKKVDKLFP